MYYNYLIVKLNNNLQNKTLKETAFQFLLDSKKPVEFYTMWEKIVSHKLSNQEQLKLISEFYNSLMKDKRFYKTANNEWTLRDFYSYDKVQEATKSAFYEMEDDSKTQDVSLEEDTQTADTFEDIEKE